jgi:LPPG:FO 2-phospho-L-lactate transferase
MAGESWSFLDQLGRLGGPTWFRLGDRDLALHIRRRQLLAEGKRLTEVTAEFRRSLGIAARILPMCDAPVRTIVHTVEGDLAFQEYFVGRRCEVAVRGFSFAGIEAASLSAEVEQALENPRLEAILIGPSNPFVSIDPILSVPGLRHRLVAARVPVVGVSPIIAGSVVKGPAAKMMLELSLDPTVVGVAEKYQGLIDNLLIDSADTGSAPAIEALGIRTVPTGIWMTGREDRRRVAQAALAAALRS